VNGRAPGPRFAIVTAAWLVHLYTATGVLFAFLAAVATIEDDYRRAFFWLALQIAVDATDGVLARRVVVGDRIPWFNGAKLDDIVDYLAYVFVPALMVWRGAFVPPPLAFPVAAAMLLSSAYGFNRDDAKTPDHFFTGFPSYWNIVVLYMFLGAWPPAANAVALLALSVLVFVPVRYVYPTRTPVWRTPSVVLGSLWGSAMIALLWWYPEPRPALFAISLLFPAYYVGLSLLLNRRRARNRGMPGTTDEEDIA
jgi:phosphatidylcholine synthase